MQTNAIYWRMALHARRCSLLAHHGASNDIQILHMNCKHTIGYFGIPGRNGGMTHLVNENLRPLCGAVVHASAEYQWCFPDWRMADPECKRCQKIRLGWLISFNEDKPPKMLRQIPPKPDPTPAIRLLQRIQEYLEVGGLFNPELMEHDKVRDLIIDCRDYIEKHTE